MGFDKNKLLGMTPTLRRIIESCPTEIKEIPPGIYSEKLLSVMREESKKNNESKEDQAV